MRIPGQAPHIVFRADASPRIGIGHVMRCLTLAEVLTQSGYSIGFVSSAETVETVPRLSRSGYEIRTELPTTAALLIIDHYGLGEEYEESASSHVNHLMVIDDLPNRRHRCDLLLDQTYGRIETEWSPLVGPRTTILAGSQYALLQSEFLTLREEALARRGAKRRGAKHRTKPVERILISLGGTDPDNVTGTILSALEDLRCEDLGVNISIDVVMGSRAPHLDAIRAQVAGKAILLHIDVDSLAPLMLNADLAIGAGGTTSWERCCLGLPTVVVEIADNQRDIISHLLAADAALDGGPCKPADRREFRDRVRSAILAPDRLATVSANAARLCDGKGSWRVAEAISSLLSSSPRNPI